MRGDTTPRDPRTIWARSTSSKVAGMFLMTDLLQLVGDIGPIDGITTVSTL